MCVGCCTDLLCHEHVPCVLDVAQTCCVMNMFHVCLDVAQTCCVMNMFHVCDCCAHLRHEHVPCVSDCCADLCREHFLCV